MPVKIAVGLWRVLRPVAIFATSLSIVLGMLFVGWHFAYGTFVAPVDVNNKETVRVVIKSGSTVRSIAKQLHDAEPVPLIRNRGFFQYATEFFSQGAKLKAGEYDLSPSMSVAEIISTLTKGDGGQLTMTIRIAEGSTIQQMADSLVTQGALTEAGKTEFLALCKTGEAFRDIGFVETLVKSGVGNRLYALEGYLFPDTYEIYQGERPQVIIRKLLARTNEIFSVNYHSAALEAEMTMDQVLTLASMIQKEAKLADFAKVSAVFHNRINSDMRLDSDVTVKYVLGTDRMALTDQDISIQSPFNTYIFKGLPPGPICAPRSAAMDAAITPDESMMSEGSVYLYFCSRDPESGALLFSKTLEDHQKAVSQYRPSWVEYDRKKAAATPKPSATPAPSTARP